MRKIWDGKGECGDRVHFYKQSGVGAGQLVGRPYVRARVRQYLRAYGLFSKRSIDLTLWRTVDNDEWLARRNGCVVAAVCRDTRDLAFDIHYGRGYRPANLGDIV